MIRSLLLLCFFVSPFKIIESRLSIKHQNNAVVVAMVPPPPSGGHFSKQATNKLNPPGCSVNRSETNKRDGSIEIRETLTCTTVTNVSPSNKVTTEPKSGSKQDIRTFFRTFLKQRK